MIGRTLINKIKDKYQDYLRIAVIAYDNEMHFFDRFANIVVNYPYSERRCFIMMTSGINIIPEYLMKPSVIFV
jgi:hypothetical protein